MPMDVHIDDIYELSDVQEMDGQEIVNVYFYRTGAIFATTTPTNAQVVAERFEAQMIPVLCGVQVSALVHRQIQVRNLYDAADSFVLDISEAGVNDADRLGTFEAYPFKLQPETAEVRAGSKRVAGVFEVAQTNGIITDAGVITALGAISDEMAAPLLVGLVIQDPVFFPVVVKRERSGSAGNYTYALPSVRGEGVWSNILTALFDVLITSQVSRKIGVGV